MFGANTMQVCKDGVHTLTEVFRASNDPVSESVVRWCGVCGGIVVDIDYDGRTNAGQILPFRVPIMVHNFNKLMKAYNTLRGKTSC